jgi:hypothetical protein
VGAGADTGTDSLPLRHAPSRRFLLFCNAMLPSVTFAHSATLGGARRFIVSMLLPIPAALYVVHMGEPGSADALSALMREGGIYLALRSGADSAGAMLVAGVLGTFVIPMLGFALAWSAARLATAQVLLAWLAQSLVNTCFYLHGNVYTPDATALAAAVRLPGLDMLHLTGVSMAVGGVFFLLGAALFVAALMLPLRDAVDGRMVRRMQPRYA